MRKIGSSEAKARFSQLLGAAEKGETIVITRLGDPLATLDKALATAARADGVPLVGGSGVAGG